MGVLGEKNSTYFQKLTLACDNTLVGAPLNQLTLCGALNDMEVSEKHHAKLGDAMVGRSKSNN